MARIAAQRSAVLLRNEARVLPLAKDTTKSIAVIGPLGDAKRDMLTMWSGFDLDPSTTVTCWRESGTYWALAPESSTRPASS